MRNMIQNLKDSHTVLVSSHILTEISETCDRLLVLGKGEILGSGSEAELASTITSSARTLVVAKPASESEDGAIEKVLRSIESVSEVKLGGMDDGVPIYEVTSSADVRAEICRALVGGGHDVLQLAQDKHELEKIFMQLVVPDSDKPSRRRA